MTHGRLMVGPKTTRFHLKFLKHDLELVELHIILFTLACKNISSDFHALCFVEFALLHGPIVIRTISCKLL